MTMELNRRNVLKATAVVAALGASGLAGAQQKDEKAKPHKWLNALKIGMLPKKLSDKEKFELAKRAGFDGIDGSPMNDHAKAKAQADLARETGVPIHGLVFGGWQRRCRRPIPR